jgi:SAM-dependent methyltransferase
LQPVSHPHALTAAQLLAALEEFLALRSGSADAYLESKRRFRPAREELVRAYGHIRTALAPGQRILDWGCRHAALSWLARAEFHETLSLHGCDVFAAQDYADFHRRIALDYRRIRHPWRLDYPDASFDGVIAGGTLEHVPNDGESLTELWRVLSPGGALLITHLPNAGSWTEFISRRLFPHQAHQRRYRLGEFRRRLLHHGFEVTSAGWHQLTPSGLPPALRRLDGLLQRVQPLNRLERVWPVRGLSASLWLVARKREGF